MADFPAQKNNAPPKILSSFLYKSIVFAIFIALLPLFPPQLPESLNPAFLSGAWELLHLLLVGIAVSYGLFSRRNADGDKEKEIFCKSDSSSYFARILQISSVFDEEESRSETWSSQYNRTDPIVVESKPLLLPVRSLKTSRVQNWDYSGSSIEFISSPVSWSAGSRRMMVREEEGLAMADSVTIPSFNSFPSNGDSTVEKSFHGGIPPSPPPPPPQPSFRYGLLPLSKSSLNKNFKDELKNFSRKGEEILKNSTSDPSPLRSMHLKRIEEAQILETVQILQQQKYQTENRKKKKVGFMEKLIVMSEDSDSEREGDSSELEDRDEAVENEVDKKADEFIAKFKQQIRLQRAESIKKSNGNKSIKRSK